MVTKSDFSCHWLFFVLNKDLSLKLQGFDFTGHMKCVYLFMVLSFSFSALALPVPVYDELPFVSPESSGVTNFETYSSHAISVLSAGNTAFYFEDVHLTDRLKESLQQSQQEVLHTLYLLLVAEIAALAQMMSPQLAVYWAVKNSIWFYQRLRIWYSRLYLAGHIASWGYEKAVEWWYSDSQYVPVTLFAGATAQIKWPSNEKEINNDSIPVELMFYLYPSQYCETQPEGFNGFLCAMTDKGVRRWTLSYQSEEKQIHHRFLFESGEETQANFSTAEAAVTSQGNGLSLLIQMLSLLLSPTALAHVSRHFQLPYALECNSQSFTPWSGNHLAVLPVGCSRSAWAFTLENAGDVPRGQQWQVPDGFQVSGLSDLDVSMAHRILDNGTRHYLIPSWLSTVLLEIVGELVEEAGTAFVDHWLSSEKPKGPVVDLTGEVEEARPLVDSTREKKPTLEKQSAKHARPPPSSQVTVEKSSVSINTCHQDVSPWRYLMEILEDRKVVYSPDFENLLGYIDRDQFGELFDQVVAQQRIDYVSPLLNMLKEEEIWQLFQRALHEENYDKTNLLGRYLPDEYLVTAIADSAQDRRFDKVRMLVNRAPQIALEEAFGIAIKNRDDSLVELLAGRVSVETCLDGLRRVYRSEWTSGTQTLLGAMSSRLELIPKGVMGRIIRRAALSDNIRLLSMVVPELETSFVNEVLHFSIDHGKVESVGLLKDYATEKGISQGVNRILRMKPRGHQLASSMGQQLLHGSDVHKKLLSALLEGAPESLHHSALVAIARKNEEGLLRQLKPLTRHVSRDKALISLVAQGDLGAVQTMATIAHYDSILRASIYARNSSHYVIAEWLTRFMRRPVADDVLWPLPDRGSYRHRESVRRHNNQLLGRVHLGSKFYIYTHRETPAKRAFLIAHGAKVRRASMQAPTAFSFLAPDEKVLSSDHVKILLERDFKSQEHFQAGHVMSDYFLSKNYNPSYDFFAPADGREGAPRKKVTAIVLSQLREHLHKAGESMDIITVRKSAYSCRMSELASDLVYRSRFLPQYEEVVLGCCRCYSYQDSLFDKATVTSNRYVQSYPDFYGNVLAKIRLTPGMEGTKLWHPFLPLVHDAEGWLRELARHGDPYATAGLREVKRARDSIKRRKRQSQPKAVANREN